jgi:hypothetical protein
VASQATRVLAARQAAARKWLGALASAVLVAALLGKAVTVLDQAMAAAVAAAAVAILVAAQAQALTLATRAVAAQASQRQACRVLSCWLVQAQHLVTPATLTALAQAKVSPGQRQAAQAASSSTQADHELHRRQTSIRPQRHLVA